MFVKTHKDNRQSLTAAYTFQMVNLHRQLNDPLVIMIIERSTKHRKRTVTHHQKKALRSKNCKDSNKYHEEHGTTRDTSPGLSELQLKVY